MIHYSLNKPINISVGVNTTFTIRTDDLLDILYSGTTYRNIIDILPILKQITPLPTYEFGNKLIKYNYNEFAIEKNNTVEHISTIWDYKDTINTDDPYFIVTSYGIQDYIFYDQYFPLSVINIYDHSGQVYLSEEEDEHNGGNIDSFDVNLELPFYIMNKVDNNFRANHYVYYYISGKGNITKKYKTMPCRPDNLITLYYINKQGGLCWVHCDMKNIISNNIKRNQIEVNEGIRNYNIQNYKSYVLNTNFLTDEQSKQIQDLFTSPKVWLLDYISETPYPVVITDTKSTIKSRKNDKMFNYTINCRDAQTENIFA